MKISRLDNIKITGMFTHFADSDSADKTFAWEQFNKFLYMTNELEKRGIKDIIRHGANSGAILDIPEFYLDMVRAGIILYGLMPSKEVKKSIDIIPPPRFVIKLATLFPTANSASLPEAA